MSVFGISPFLLAFWPHCSHAVARYAFGSDIANMLATNINPNDLIGIKTPVPMHRNSFFRIFALTQHQHRHCNMMPINHLHT